MKINEADLIICGGLTEQKPVIWPLWTYKFTLGGK